jgi:hypothetical protein
MNAALAISRRASPGRAACVLASLRGRAATQRLGCGVHEILGVDEILWVQHDK